MMKNAIGSMFLTGKKNSQDIFSPLRGEGISEGAGGGFDAVIGNPPYVRHGIIEGN